MKRLAIVITHPIQYYAPLFRLLTERSNIIIKVFYTWGEQGKGKLYDPGFGKLREWDIPLLQGYDFEFVVNTSLKPGSHHFWGINNPGLIKKIVKWTADAVLVIGWKFISHLKVLLHFKGKLPVLFRGDSTLLDEVKGFSMKKIVRRLSLSFIYRFVDFAFYVGTNNKAYFLRHGLLEKQLILAPYAIDMHRFNGNPHDLAQEAFRWKLQLNIPIHKPSVLFAGKLESKKNPLFLINAAIDFPQMHFIVVGSGALEADINEKAKSLKNLTFLPFQNQSRMPMVYRLADIFVLPSKGPGETWGLAINEAMASGRVVIASNKCGGAIDLIKNGENGFIIKPEEEEFFKKLAWLERSPAEIIRFKKYSGELIKDFTFEKISISIELLMINVLGAKYFSTN